MEVAMEAHKLKGYSLESFHCKNCGCKKLHEICYCIDDKKDYIVCQTCGETTEKKTNENEN